MQSPEDRNFERFQRTGAPEALAAAFDVAAPELWRIGWYLSGGNRHRAEDALQATFLTAIEDRDSWDSARPLRPWLLGILNNHVKKERRRDQRPRIDPAEGVSRHLKMDAPAPGDPASEAEIRQLVADAIRTLKTPYREVMVLHLEHGLTAQEVADATDRKPATVRTQIVRGLELLRRALPAGLAGSGAALALPSVGAAADAVARVRTATLSHAATTVPVVQASAWALFTLTKTHLMIALLASLLSLIAYSFWPGADLRLPPASGGEAQVAKATEDLRPEGPRRALVAGQPGRLPALGQRRGPDTYTLRLVVRDPEGKPIPHAHVMAKVGGRARYDYADASGRLEFRGVPVSTYYQISMVGNEKQISGMLRGVRPFVRDLELKVDKGATLNVKVVDAAGAPCEGAMVEGVLGAQWERMHNPLGRTGADGVLSLPWVRPSGQLRAFASGHQLSRLLNFSVPVGATKDVTLRLGAPAVIGRGRVVDEKGQPLPKAELAVVQFGNRATCQYFGCDAEGQFKMDWLEPTRHFVIGRSVVKGVTRIGYGRIDLGSGSAAELSLVLRPGLELRGTVRNEAGDPVMQAQLSVQIRIDGVYRVPFTGRSLRSGAGGSFVFTDLPAGEYGGRAGDDVEVFAKFSVQGDRANEWNPTLPAARPIVVRIVDSQNRPLAGWRVELWRVGTDLPEGGGLTTDEDGLAGSQRWSRWRVGPNERREVILRAPVPEGVKGLRGRRNDWFPSLVAPPIGPSEQPHTIRVPDRNRLNASIRGRVLDREGNPAGKVRVRLSSKRGRYSDHEFWTGAEDGRFSVLPLSPGRYTLRIKLSTGQSFSRELHIREAGELDLGDLRPPKTSSVTVRLAGVDGRPVASTVGVQVRIRGANGLSYRARRQADGSYLAPRVARGPATILAWSREHPTLRRPLRIGKAAGTVELKFQAPVARTPIHIRLPKTQDRSQQGWWGTVTVRDARNGDLVRSFDVRHAYRGEFTSLVKSSAALAPGRYVVSLKSFDDLRASVDLEVPGAAVARSGVELVLPEHRAR